MKRKQLPIPTKINHHLSWFTCSGFTLLIIITILPTLMTGCGQSQLSNTPRSGIVATIFPLYDLTKNITGDAIPTHLILPPGRSPHEYQLTPSDRLQLRTAKILIMTGGGVDSWIVKAAVEEEKHGLIIIGLYQLEGGERLLAHEHEDEDSTASANQPLNPHQWLVPRAAEDFVRKLTETLAAQYPDQSQSFQSQLQNALNQLNNIDNDYREHIRGIKDRRMITFHDAFDPLAQEYALDIVATIYRVESQQLTPADMTRLKNHINDGVRAVFAEPQFESGSLQQLGNQITIRTLDPLGGRTSPPGYLTYYEMMESNLKALVEGLKDNQGN